MGTMELITTFVLVILFLLLLYYSTRRPPNFPPGIRRIPIIGQYVKGSKPSMDLWKSHTVVGSYIGNHPTISIHNFHLAKELFNREEYCGRGVNFITRYLRSDSGINKGIISSDGVLWTEQRRFALKHLKDFGFGRIGLEGVIQGEVEDLLNYLAKQESKDFKMDTVFGIPVINILWTIVAGKRFELDDPKVQRVMILLNRLFKAKFALEYFFIWWGLICYFIPGLSPRRKIISELRTMFRDSIKDHRDSLDTNHPRDFIDVYLIEILKGTNPYFDQEGLELTCLDLFKAGAETSSTTILWVILYLVKYQDVQEKCYQEIVRVTGEERPSLQHSLPYCQAVIMEVQRLACVAPQTIPHRITRDVSVEGYDVPQDSVAMANLWGFMKDPDHWEDPLMFHPERFLEKTDGGLKVTKKERFVPYGIGRRVCMGESLAKDTLFIFVTTLVKNLKFENPVNHPKPDPENYTDGFTVIPHPYHVKLICRK